MTNPFLDPDSPQGRALRVLEIEMSGLVSRFRLAMRSAADRLSPGLHPGAYKTFTMIAQRGPVTPSALAELLFVDKGLLSRTIRTLEELGLIERTPDPDDGRSSLLSASESGRERLKEVHSEHHSPLLEGLSSWTVEELEQFAVLLHALGTGSRPGLSKSSCPPPRATARHGYRDTRVTHRRQRDG